MMQTLQPVCGSVRRLALAAMVAASCPACGLAPGSRAAPGAGDSLAAAIREERERAARWLASSPTSYLAAVRRADFGERRSLTVGSAPGNDLRLQDAAVRGRHLEITVVGDSFRVEALEAGARFRAGAAELPAATLPPGGDRGRPLPSQALPPALPGADRVRP